MIPENFREWACSLSGCDGGNKNAQTWLCGIEWGGGSGDDGVYYKSTLPGQIAQGKYVPEGKAFDWQGSLNYPYGRSFAKLYAAIENHSVEQYYDLAMKTWNGSELFKLNLYPIAFDSTDLLLWHKYGLDKVTGFDEKHLFQTWCFVNRFPVFSKLRTENKPKRIICTGVSYLRDFFLCFGGNQNSSDSIQYEDIAPESSSSIQNKRRFYWVALDDTTTLFVIPFLSGQYGLNSNYLLQEMGKRIRELS